MKYEDALEKVQGNQAFTACIMLILSLNSFMTSLDMNSLIFLNYKPKFNCTDLRLENASNIKWLTKTEQCKAEIFPQLSSNRSIIINCNRFEYDQSVMHRSISTEFNLVCDREYIMTAIDMVFFVGIVFGNFLGMIGDRIGRKKLILVTSCFELIVSIILPFIPNVWGVLIFRFIWGFSFSKIYQGICILTEIVTVNKREFYGNNIWIFWVLGYMIVPGIAYAVRDWRYLRMLSCIPFVFYWLLYFIPESPRWLSIHGRDNDAYDTLVYIGKYNGVKLDRTDFKGLNVKKELNISFLNLLGYPTSRLKLIVGSIVQLTVMLSYFGLSINSSFISKNIFLNAFAQGTLEILTGPLGWILSSKFNRKISIVVLYIITAVSLLITGFLPVSSGSITSVISPIFAIIGKFTLTTNFCIIDMYLPEMFPTIIRNMAIFIIIGIGSTGSVFAPFINRLGSKLSISFYSILCLISATLVWFLLPETKGIPLPESIEQGENLRRGNEKNFCDIIMIEQEVQEPLSISQKENAFRLSLLNDNHDL